jgi:hypothetical protein
MTISKHSPEILTGIGIAGMITTTVLAVKATPKAIRLLEETYGDNNGRPFPAVDVVKTCWKCYIPAAITGAVSITCLIGASNVNARKNAAIATAYKISERALTEYKDKVVETIGEKKERAIRENIDKDRIEKNPVSKSEVIITEKGNTLCYDSISGRYFKSDIDKIEKAVNEINRKMLNEMYISLNEFYDELGLNHTSLGSSLGWNIDNGLLELEFGSQISDDGTPCVVVNYSVAPKYDYSRFFM